MLPPYELTTAQLDEGISRCVENINSLLEGAKTLANIKSNHSLGLYIFAVEEFGKAILMKEKYDKNNKLHIIPQNWFHGKEAHKEKLKAALQKLPDNCKRIGAKIVTIPYGPYKANVDEATKIWQHEQTRVNYAFNGKLILGNSMITLPLDVRMRENCFHVSYDVADRRFKNPIAPRSQELKKSIEEMQKTVKNFDWSL